MKIRFISDLHYYLNMQYSPTETIDIFSKIEPADITLIAGDASAEIEEMSMLLDKYFHDERVIFVNGNHALYHTPCESIQDIIEAYRKRFFGKWLFLENNYTQLDDKLFCIGCCGWTNFEYGHKTKSQYIREIEQEKQYREKHKFVDTGKIFGEGTEFDRGVQPVIFTNYLPEDPAKEYDELQMGNKESYRGRRMKDAVRHMNDYNYGKIRREDGSTDILRPSDTYNMHQESLKYIEKAYNVIVEKVPDATIILMTHHPFTKKCVSGRYKDDVLTSAFVSEHDRWLKKFPNIKYIHCGHVHQRFFDKVGDKTLICNPAGYFYYGEHLQSTPFNINYMLEVKTR